MSKKKRKKITPDYEPKIDRNRTFDGNSPLIMTGIVAGFATAAIVVSSCFGHFYDFGVKNVGFPVAIILASLFVCEWMRRKRLNRGTCFFVAAILLVSMGLAWQVIYWLFPEPPPFSVAINLTIGMDRTNEPSPLWVINDGNGGRAAYPVAALLSVECTNTGSRNDKVDSFSIEGRSPSTDWETLHTYDIPRWGTLFYAPDFHHAMEYLPIPLSLDSSLAGRTFAPGDSLRGWILFAPTKAKSITEFRMKIEDATHGVTIQTLGPIARPLENQTEFSGFRMFPPETDIDKIPRKSFP